MTQEVNVETRETLHVLEQTRMERPQKLAAERSYFDGAHEVRFTERSFHPRQGASIDEVRAFVDSLDVKRRELPPLPEIAPAERPAVLPKIPDHYREPLEAVIRGALISVDTVHRVGTNVVVDVAWESEDEGERRGLYIIEDGKARPQSEVDSNVDSLPAPRAPRAEGPASASEPASAPASEPASASEKPKKRFGFGKKEKPAEPAPSEAPAPAEEPRKRRFGFGKK